MDECRLVFRSTKCGGQVFDFQIQPKRYIKTCYFHASIYWKLLKLAEWNVGTEELADMSIAQINKRFDKIDAEIQKGEAKKAEKLLK